MPEESRPLIGVGVIIKKSGKVLLGQRINSHGHKTWCFPGGHLEFKESYAACARRETQEETDLKIKNLCFVTATNDFFKKENKHYVTIYVAADYASGSLKLMEPNKCLEWRWFTWEKLPRALFLPIQHLKKTGFHPFKASSLTQLPL